jgi:hypothetical protein
MRMPSQVAINRKWNLIAPARWFETISGKIAQLERGGGGFGTNTEPDATTVPADGSRSRHVPLFQVYSRCAKTAQNLAETLVGVRGFEPPAPASRRQCSTRADPLSISANDHIADGRIAKRKVRRVPEGDLSTALETETQRDHKSTLQGSRCPAGGPISYRVQKQACDDDPKQGLCPNSAPCESSHRNNIPKTNGCYHNRTEI